MKSSRVGVSHSQVSSVPSALIFSGNSLESDVRLFFRPSFQCYWEFSYFSLCLMRRWDQDCWPAVILNWSLSHFCLLHTLVTHIFIWLSSVIFNSSSLFWPESEAELHRLIHFHVYPVFQSRVQSFCGCLLFPPCLTPPLRLFPFKSKIPNLTLTY